MFNNKSLKAPIYKAQSVYDDTWIFGHYLPKYWLEGLGYMNDVILEDTGYYRDVHYIDTNTLKISFNDEDWFALAVLSDKLNFVA